VAEWLKAAVLKTAEVQNASGGSNPSSPAVLLRDLLPRGSPKGLQIAHGYAGEVAEWLKAAVC
jgi:hypothetical protein